MRAEFTDDLITGNELIDSQHEELIGRINKLLDSCETGEGKVSAIKMLDYLAKYTYTHLGDEEALQKVIPKDCAGDFNQGLIELGAIVCVPNGEPKCEECPAAPFCQARLQGKIQELPVKEKAKARRIEKKTVLILRDEDKIAICKRPAKGLLAGLYELPNIEEHLNKKEITQYCKEIGLMPIHIKKLPEAKHIFSHIEWHMIGYDIRVDELEKTNNKNYLFIHPEEIQQEYPIPSAFEKYMKLI